MKLKLKNIIISFIIFAAILIGAFFVFNNLQNKAQNPPSQTAQIKGLSQEEKDALITENTVLLNDDKLLKGQVDLLKIATSNDIKTTSTKVFNTPLPTSISSYESLTSMNADLKRLKSDYKKAIENYRETLKTKGKFTNPLWDKTDEELKAMISEMPNEEKMGQMLMFASKGYSLTTSYKKEIETMHLGGIIYMGWSISKPEQLTKFSKDLQAINTQIPMLLATDQEGGAVKRVFWDPTTGEVDWSSMTDSQICAQAKQRADLLRSLGININFAPVVDLTYNGEGFINNRTISEKPKIVSAKAKQAVDCSQTEGVATALKHFPGHGATSQDSHKVLPEITKSKSQWLRSDAIPFKNLTESKIIMVGHLLFESLDKTYPASQSEKIVSGILRGEFGYEGVVITDAMGQLHNSTKVNVRTALTRSFNSGVDIVLYVTTPGTPKSIFKTGVDLLNTNAISTEKVNASLFRILSLKRSIR